MTRVQAIGGAVAVVVGVYMMNSFGTVSSGRVSFGNTSITNSVVVFNRNRVTDCTAVSVTDNSLGSSSVFGGAFAILHSPQVSNFRTGVLQPSVGVRDANGFNFTVLIRESHFFECSVFSSALSSQPGGSNGGGGAIYAKSAALTNFSVTESTFNSSIVSVASGATGLPSFSSGGALAVEAGNPRSSIVTISSCTFFSCNVQGVNAANLGVLGGAAHVFRAGHISVTRTSFTNCSVTNADSDATVGNVISGGSALSAVVTGSMSVFECVFDASGGRDASQTSTGLLVLARNASSAHANVTSCEFKSSTVVFSVKCVDDDGVRRFGGLCIGLNVALRHSRIRLLPLKTEFQFSTQSSELMAFHHQDSVLFTGSSMYCALPQFAAFKIQAGNSSMRSTVYSCRPCPSFRISSTATVVSLEELSTARNVDRCFPVSSDSSVTSACPFAVADCTTFVFVTAGFWANVSESGQLEKAHRCPRGYCGCINATNGACPLPPLISINRNPNPLCTGNRTGKLCGGCASGFTQSLDDVTCISNEACSKDLWWVWTLSILGFAAYSLYIVLSSSKRSDGALACLVFYFQMSSYLADGNQSNGVVAIFEYAQMHSIVAMYQNACYAPSMSAYNATAFKLIGPLLVLLFAVAWTWIIRKLQPRLRRRNIDISVSYGGTLAVTVLFVFSNVSIVVFTLVECSSYSGPDAVVFIDGTVPCGDATWSALVFIAVLLFLFPAAFAVALRLKDRFQTARDTVCGKYTGQVSYWGAITLSFRLLISVAQFLRVDYPNVLAFARSLLSMVMLFLLVNLRPYVHERTFWVDVACYVCLIVQFGLQIFAATREFLASSSIRESFFTDVSTSSSVIR